MCTLPLSCLVFDLGSDKRAAIQGEGCRIGPWLWWRRGCTFLAMGALESGLKEEELPELVSQWRAACPRIKDYWWRVHREALNAIRYGTVRTVGRLVFSYDGGLLKIRLPSGRNLIYLQPAITVSPSGFTEISYKAADKGELKTFSTYGPKLVENIVQGMRGICLQIPL